MNHGATHSPYIKLAVAGALATAGGLALTAIANPAHAATPATKAWHKGWARCFGVNAAYKNNCLTATGSCAGTDPKAHDPNAYVWMPAGVCKEVGGSAIPGPKAAAHIKKIMQMNSEQLKKTTQVARSREAEIYYQSSAEFFRQVAKWAGEHH